MGNTLCSDGLTIYDFDKDEDTRVQDRRLYKTDMEAEFIAHYLGSSMLTKGTTGLGVIQKPLKDKYFAFRKSAENRLGPEIIVRINPSGILMIFPGSKSSQDTEEFYELSSVHFIEAVHYVTMKQKDKKFYGAFVPIEDDRNSNASHDKLFTQIDKKFSHLTKISHPPMLTCVMRRPTGVKAVDCHMLVVPVTEDALRMTDMVRRFQEHPVGRDVNNYGYGGPPPQIRRENNYPNPDIIPRDFPREARDQRDDRGGKRNSSEDYEIYRGERLELRQDHFRRNEHENDNRVPNNHSFDSDRSFDKDRSSGSYRDFDRGGSDRGDRYPPRDEPVTRRPRELRVPNGAYVERDSMGIEYEFDNAIIHERKSSGSDRDSRWLGGDRGGFSPRGNDMGGRSPRGMSPRGEDYNRGFLRNSGDYGHGRYDRSPNIDRGPPDWPTRGNNVYRDNEPTYGRPQRPGGDPRMVSPRDRSPSRGHSPPRGHSSPRSPRSPRSRSPEDEIYSASNLESRMEADQLGRPVAKVPPHRHAGVRVLPSIPIADVKHQLKHVTPKSEQTKEDQVPKYNLESKNDYSDDENPYDNHVRLPHNNNNDQFRKDRYFSDNSEPEMRNGNDIKRNSGNRVKNDGYNYSYDQGQQQNRAATTKPWSFEEEKEKFLRKEKETAWNGGYSSKSANENYDDDDRFESEYSGRGKNGIKDAEIADMFSNLRTGNAGSRDVDFEQSLGYLP